MKLRQGPGDRPVRRLEHRAPGNRPEELEVEPEELGLLPEERAWLGGVFR